MIFQLFPEVELYLRNEKDVTLNIFCRLHLVRFFSDKTIIKFYTPYTSYDRQEILFGIAHRVGMPFLDVTNLPGLSRMAVTNSSRTARSQKSPRAKTPAVYRYERRFVYVRKVRRQRGSLTAPSPSTSCRLYRLTYGRFTTGTQPHPSISQRVITCTRLSASQEQSAPTQL